jgi:riboflavin kinase / FMN adenylyltransferase
MENKKLSIKKNNKKILDSNNKIKITGIVIHGRQEGRKIGFPTANIDPKFYKNCLAGLEYGVYATRTIWNGKVYNSISNYGTAPVYNFEKILFETYIFDFDFEIYGQEITVEVVEFLRPVLNFDSVESLIVQIQKDCKLALQALK